MSLPSTSWKLVFTSDPQWSSFAAAALEASTIGGTLVVDSACVLAVNLVVSAPMVFAGGKITLGNYNLTISKLNTAPLDQQIFVLTGSGLVTINSLLTPLSPEMFGGGVGSATDNFAAFSAIAAVAHNSGIGVTIVLGTGIYQLSDQPVFDDIPGMFIRGAGIGETIVQRTGEGTSNPIFWFQATGSGASVTSGGIEGCTLDGSGVAAYCLRHTSCSHMLYSNLRLENATDIAWYWDCNTESGDWNNAFCLTQAVSIDQSGTGGGGLCLDGNSRNNTGPCTFVQLRIEVKDGDALTLAGCGDNTFLQCSVTRTDGSNGRGLVLGPGPGGNGTPVHNQFYDLQTAFAGVYALTGHQNFAVLDTDNAGSDNPPVVAPGAQFTYLNEVMIENLAGVGFTAVDADQTQTEAFALANELANWRQNYTQTVTASLTTGSPTVTMADGSDTRGIIAGMFVTDNTTGGNIAPGTTVTVVTSQTELTIYPAAAGNSGAGGDSVTFSSNTVVITTGSVTKNDYKVSVASTTGIVDGMYVTDLTNGYIPSGTTVSQVAYSTNEIDLSNNCTGTASSDQLSFTSGPNDYPLPVFLTYAGNFISTRNRSSPWPIRRASYGRWSSTMMAR